MELNRFRLGREETVLFFYMQLGGVILTLVTVVLVFVFATDKARWAANTMLFGWLLVATLGRSRARMHDDLTFSEVRLRNWTHIGLVVLLFWLLNVQLPQ